MLVSTEMISLVTPRVGPAEGIRQKTGNKPQGDFEKALDEARSEPIQPAAFRRKNGDNIRESAIAAKRGKPAGGEDDASIVGETAGDQNAVVFILEGDMESGTTPETGAADIAAPAAGVAAGDEFWQAAAGGAPAPEEAALPAPDDMAGYAQAADAAAANAAGASAASDAIGSGSDLSASPSSPVYAERAEGGNASVAAAAESAAQAGRGEAAGAEADGIVGEVAARMPTARTSERSETGNEGNEAESADSGDLGPLENENDKAAVKSRRARPHPETETKAAPSKNAEALPDIVPARFASDIKPERFIASQHLGRAADAPVRSENLFDEIVSRIEMSAADGTRSMTIQLKPEFLGKVALEIALDGAGLHVKISAADQGVRSMVNGQLDALIASLQSKGIEVAEVEVAYTGIDNGAFTDSKSGNSRPDSPRKPRILPTSADDASYYAALPFDALEYYLDDDISSVEYRA